MCLVREAEDVAEDGTQPRLARRVEVFWRAWKEAGGEGMAMSDARMLQTLLERVEAIEALLTQVADQVQRLAAGDKDAMHQVYPPKDPEAA